MLVLQNLSYIHPNKDLLFENISLTLNPHNKAALIGNNGVGKSTLLKIIVGELKPSAGQLQIEAVPYYVPQIFGQFNHLTVAEAMGIGDKLGALNEILNGNVTDDNLARLNDDWTIEARCNEALKYWHLEDLDLSQSLGTLSGGQKTKVFLAGIHIHKSNLVLLDEPSNHLDTAGRQLLYDFIRSTSSALLVVSHDRKLLSLLQTIFEMSEAGIGVYGGGYDFYTAQKQLENNALKLDLLSKERSLRKAKEKERQTLERQQKLDARGKQKQEKSGVARIMMNTMRNNAENSTAKVKGVHAEKITGIAKELFDLRSSLPGLDEMKFGFDSSALHSGKVLFRADEINFKYGDKWLWAENINLKIYSGERIALKGLNGSGKTTLIRIILGQLVPQAGNVSRAPNRSVYIDQDYSLIDKRLAIYEQAQQFNTTGLQEHEVKTRLNRYLFGKNDWDKSCSTLSGGEKMRLTLCCLTIANQSPDIIILDEPTNNLDIQNIEILTAAINEYQGTLLVVSHDEDFLQRVNAERVIYL